MLRVRVEMCPLGDERPEAVREIGRMYIANVTPREAHAADPSRGDYEVAVCRRGTGKVPFPVDPSGPQPTRAGKVENYPRRAYNVWRLVVRALKSAFPEETGQALALTDALALQEPTDEQALELGREILGAVSVIHGEGFLFAGRNAWRRGARPRGF